MKNHLYLLKKPTLVAFLLLFANSFVSYGQTQPKLHFVAMGDSRSNQSTFSKICGLVDGKKPEVVIFSGDLWDGYSQSSWISTITGKPNLNAILNANKFLVAWGNHESCSAVQGISPTMLRGGACTYSFTEGNCFFVCLGMDPGANLTFLENQLKSAAAQAAKWKIIYHHYPIYSSGGHPIDGMTSYETICDKYNVAFSVAGHCHNYDRTKVMFGKAAVFTGNVIPATQKGTIYSVSGGAGAPLYSVATKSWQAKAVSDNNFIEFFAYDDSMRVKVYNGSGTLIDNYVRGRYDATTGVDDLNQHSTELYDARPSSFSTLTTIDYYLDKSAGVEINILDMSGRVVKTLVNGAQPAGVNTTTWNGNDNSGNSVPAGVYLCNMISGEHNFTKKLIFVK